MRLDRFLFEKRFFSSRNKAAEAICRGEIFVNGKLQDKPSAEVNDEASISVVTKNATYVSLGGYKLERALTRFKPTIKDGVFIDVGASTGGFTDCLLQNGAKKVYCVDVGENLLSPDLVNDSRIVVMDRTNARYLSESDFQKKADGIVVDCSFISLEYILPPLVKLISEKGFILALIKPQFETAGKVKMKNGILKDEKARKKIVEDIYCFIKELGLFFVDICLASNDEKKNKEYIAYISKSGESKSLNDILSKV